MSRIFVLLLLCCGSVAAFSQSIDELEERLKTADGSKEKMVLSYTLAEKYLNAGNIKKSERYETAEDHAKRANDLARQRNDNGMVAQSAFLLARIFDAWSDADRSRRSRYESNMKSWLETTISFAKKARDYNLIVNGVQKLAEYEQKDRDYRAASRVYEDAFQYFSQSGRSISKLESDYSLREIELEKALKTIRDEVAKLDDEKKRLATDNVQLVEANEKKEREIDRKDRVITEKDKEITEKDETIQVIEEEKTKAEEEKEKAELAKVEKERRIKELDKAALADSLALAESQLEAEKAIRKAQQAEASLIYLIGSGAFFLLLAIILYGRYLGKKRSNQKLRDEQERSESLLLNILPKNIAEELKEKGRTTAHKHEKVTVLFSDFKNFTAIAERLSPEQLVEELDKCFKKFDFILQKYTDIEKIKTIGDAYMCASGLNGNSQYPFNIVRAGLEMQKALEDLKQENIRLGKPFFEARIGIHTGPVVSGVVGTTKFAYDIWGDTVNIASRMESNSEVGKVNISEDTYRLIKYKFECMPRGKVQAKNKGLIDMYFVHRELSGAGVPA